MVYDVSVGEHLNKTFDSDAEDVSDVGDPLSPPLLGVHVERSGDEVLLLALDLDHLLLDRVLRDVLVDRHVLLLAEPVGPVEALPLGGGVPGGVEEKQVVGCGQVQTNPTSLQAQQHHLFSGGHIISMNNDTVFKNNLWGLFTL